MNWEKRNMNLEKKNMNIRIQSELNRIKADEALINNTETYLRDRLSKNQNSGIIKFSKYRLFSVKSLAKVACIVFILIGGSTGTYAYYKTPVSYLSLDINPSIEFGVNAFDKVVTAEGYNTDGKTVLRGLNVTGDDVTKAVSTVISSAANNGFIDNDGSTVVSLTSETDNVNSANNLEIKAETGVNEALEEKGKTAVIYKANVALAFRDVAREINITPGKLKLIKKLQEVNPIVTVEQYKDAKVKDIMKAIQTYTDNDIVYNNKGKAVSSKEESVAGSKEESVVGSKEESTVSSKEKSTVSSKEESAASSKEESVVSSKKESAVNNKKESAVNNKHEDAVTNNYEDVENANKNNAAGNEAKTDKKQQQIGRVKIVIIFLRK
jgi:hypothetical protein